MAVRAELVDGNGSHEDSSRVGHKLRADKGQELRVESGSVVAEGVGPAHRMSGCEIERPGNVGLAVRRQVLFPGGSSKCR